MQPILETSPVTPESVPTETHATPNNLIELFQAVVKKLEDHINDESLPMSDKKKRNQYGLTPGATPFPEHEGPTAEKCEEASIRKEIPAFWAEPILT